jgi:glycosyltransferase involved in cell wall biosynthesis
LQRIIVSVSNDLYSDQRVDKVCNSLVDMGFCVLLVGRKLPNSPALPPRRYATRRLRLLFKKGFLFYAELNFRLFLFLLFHRCDTLVANDLDTLYPNFLISKIKRKRLVYDSHEYFCGVPELNDRPRVQRFWRRIEKRCFPHLKDVITVCNSIAEIYNQEYPRSNKVNVVRNVPSRHRFPVTKSRAELGLPTDCKLIVMQGAINRDRGAEELILAMKEIPNAQLLIIGNGDVVPQLKALTAKESLEKIVHFIPRVSPEELANYTALCDIGCSLEKDTNLNYRYCLPNKLFDYIKAGIPCVVSNLPEMAAVVKESQVGLIIPESTPAAIAAAINMLLNDSELYASCKAATERAAEQYCWEREEEILRNIYLRS